MHRLGYVAPNLGDVPPQASPGGYVMDSRPGLYDSVLVLDYKSLYPSIIRNFLIDPVGLVEGLAQPDDQHSIEGFLGARSREISTACRGLSARSGTDGMKPNASTISRSPRRSKIIMNAFLRRAGDQRLPLLRPASRLVDHHARPCDHAPDQSVN